MGNEIGQQPVLPVLSQNRKLPLCTYKDSTWPCTRTTQGAAFVQVHSYSFSQQKASYWLFSYCWALLFDLEDFFLVAREMKEVLSQLQHCRGVSCRGLATSISIFELLLSSNMRNFSWLMVLWHHDAHLTLHIIQVISQWCFLSMGSIQRS